LISVEDRILFHKWSKELAIFTSGVANILYLTARTVSSNSR